MPDQPPGSRVVKIPRFTGSLPDRPLYIYLPPGYDDQEDRYYPTVYMHDGQNVFEAFVQDSYVDASWQADRAADRLIAEKLMRPAVIVGVGHGEDHRMEEYLPPYMTLRMKRGRGRTVRTISGQADRVAGYYIDEVAPFIAATFRVLPGRENTATCGSSMGGLLNAYFAWEHEDFARHHAIVSPAFWLTRNQEGGLEILERFAFMDRPDVRIWLDSGTLDSTGTSTQGDDGKALTIQARDVLLDKGFEIGPDFRYFLDDGARHNEIAWARRMPMILEFFYPGERSKVNSNLSYF
ncbi:MAG TPA: alpha/beta hydrolase-fold protein [Anaerolineales bacterium]|nr:alpha/beta hydrolase-fold protein [Anaerolineales bacterium]